MNYFSCFLGLPFPGTLRIDSRADLSYIGDFVLGLIPAIIRRCLTVVSFKPSSIAISATVKPSILFISAILQGILGKVKRKLRHLLCDIRVYVMRNRQILGKFGVFAKNSLKKVKKSKNISQNVNILLDNMFTLCDN